MERLDKLLANTGKWSRKEAKDLLKQGRVTVDGALAARPEDKCGETAVIAVDGAPISHSTNTYIMLHKPAGILSATEDRKQKTVLDLLTKPLQKQGLFPVGRLDKDTEGLLLLTNDGPLAHRLLAPKSHVDKVYFTRVEGILSGADCEAFAGGMELGDGLHCQPAGLEILSDPSTALVTLHEGKFHQIKRMLAALGKPVVYLKRLSMGTLALDEELAPGAWRPLTAAEIDGLMEI
ncbi:MAG: pseudouridine synthase [Oscillospiraceae bacterium]